MKITKAILLVIDGMDTVNFTLAYTPIMDGWHGKTAVGVAHTEIFGAGTTLTPIAHGMMGTGANILAHRPGKHTSGKCYDYYGEIVESIGDVAKEAGFITAAVGKNEAANVLGGIDNLDISRLEIDGIDASDDQIIIREILKILADFERGILVINYNGVDSSAHSKNLLKVIQAVEKGDKIVKKITETVDLNQTLLIIASDHGTNPLTGNHNTAPTPLCLITGSIPGRANLGIVHNMEIAITISETLNLRRPKQAIGRNLLKLAFSSPEELSYKKYIEEQLEKLWRASHKRHELKKKD
ncbi:MAG: alkaline phosphatase family protein [Armatimonadetes bacterium]|nr:alkaline phosphatase family protein [Armatimonadota bacterium]